jgi:DMSO/TMAO reductase YedYZ heme-binding membrane subunit
MPWRLILWIIIFAVILTFISFNLENKCDISFGITVFEKVPVFLTIFASFFLGLLFALPLKFGKKKKQGDVFKDKLIDKKQEPKPIKDHFSGSDGGDYGID